MFNKFSIIIKRIKHIRLRWIGCPSFDFGFSFADPYSHQVLQSQRTLEQSLEKIFAADSAANAKENIRTLVKNLIEYIPLTCALDLYYPLIRLLLSYTETHFDLALYMLCYITTITDDRSEDFGIL